MTKRELAEYFHVSYGCIENAFRRAARDNPCLVRNVRIRGRRSSDFSLEEVMFVLPYFRKITRIERELLRESFPFHGGTFVERGSPLIQGMEDFLKDWKKKPRTKCCENCLHLGGKAVRGRGTLLRPYCLFYGFFLTYRKNVNIFKDYCRTFRYRGGKPPLWYKKSIPSGKNLFDFSKGVDESRTIHFDGDG